MPYQYANQRQDYSDYASGKVFYNLPGHPAFPIRLASEIFQRCMEIRKRTGQEAPVTLFDPLCGGAYHLATLGYFHWDQVAEILASDIDPDAISVGARNLSLLTLEGMDRRSAELARNRQQYGKESHAEALASAARLRERLEERLSSRPIPTRIFQADALDTEAITHGLSGIQPDLVFTDIPYGRQTTWQVPELLEAGDSPIGRMLAALAPNLSNRAVVAVAAPKSQKVRHPAYAPAGKLRVGLRQVTFLQLNASINK